MVLSLFLVGFVLRLLVSWRSVPCLTKFCLVDDSFYVFNIARNIALGHGFHHDSFNSTNGFQPLIVFIDSIVYYLLHGEKILSIKVILFLHCLISLLAALMLYKLTRLVAGGRAALYAVLMWSVTSYCIRQDLNGMETGLVTLLITCAAYYYLAMIRIPGAPVFEARPFAVLGVLCGLAVLARIDAVIFIAVLLGDAVWLGWRSRVGARALLRALVPFSLLVVLLSLPWLLVNAVYFGSVMPVSGPATRFLSFAYSGRFLDLPAAVAAGPGWRFYASVLKISLRVLLANQPLLFGVWLSPHGAVACLLVAALYLVFCGKRLRRYCREWRLARLNFLLVYGAALVSVYSFYVLGYWHFARYYYPVMCISLVYGALLVEVLVLRIGEKWGGASARLAIMVAGGAVILNQAGMDYRLLRSGEIGGYVRMAAWVNMHTEEDDIIGVFQSGTVGYFADRRFVGLDGVVNKDALEAMRDRRMGRYLHRTGVDYVMDWWEVLDALLFSRSDPGDLDLRLEHVASAYFDIYRVHRGGPAGGGESRPGRVPASPSGSSSSSDPG